MFMTADIPPEQQLAFSVARDNFYKAAQHGLDAQVSWLDDTRCSMQSLLLERLLPMAREGLEQLEIDSDDINRYLGIIESRLLTGQTGSVWQRRYVERHGHDLVAMTQAYHALQEKALPVHEWDFD